MIDAHLHFWRLERGDYPWLTPALQGLYRDYLPDDALPMLRAAGVTEIMVVQAAETEEETRFLFELAREHSWIVGIIGWTRFDTIDAAARIAALVSDGGGMLKGLRPMLQDMGERGWVARPDLDGAFDAMVAHGLVLDALVRVDQLAALQTRAQRTPALRVVIDHAAKPDIAGEAHDAWANAIAPLSRLSNVYCKLSGLLTEAQGKDVSRYVETALALFGRERLIWGSDWPVLTLTGTYAGWLAQARKLAPDPAIYGDNARRVYRLATATQLLVLDPLDNVGVALSDLAVAQALIGNICATEPIPFGFKAAVRDIAAGEAVIKYGVAIGSATRAIVAGERVHIHNMQSEYTRTHTRELEIKA